jgi:hypothetical protein
MLRHTGVTVIVAGLIALCSMLLPAVASATSPTGITGTARNFNSATHETVANAQVCVTPKKGGSTTCTSTQTEGKYTLELTAGEEYTVEFTGNICVGLSCEPVYVKHVSPPVLVKSGELAEVNVELLEVDGKISGRVTSNGTPVASIDVCAFGSGPGFGCHATNANGEYTIEHLAPGSYTVSFRSLVPPSCKVLGCQRANYITQYWNGQPTSEASGRTRWCCEHRRSVTAEPGG